MNNSYFSKNPIVGQINTKRSMNKPTISVSTFIISLVMVIFFVIIIFLKWGDIKGFFGIGSGGEDFENSIGLSVGDDVVFEGYINNSGDMENYTHTYMSNKFGLIGLRSKSIVLDTFLNKFIHIEGIIEKFTRGIAIINVTKIYEIDMDHLDQKGSQVDSIITGETKVRYFPKMGLFFNDEFFNKYSFVNDGDGSELKVKNLETNIIYDINYFKCDTSAQGDKNCDYLNNLYSQSSNNKYVDRYGVNYYKDLEVNSRFFSSDSFFGYRVNDVEDSFIRDLSTLMTVINKNFAEKNILPNVKSICVFDYSIMDTITKSELNYKIGDFYYVIEGFDEKDNKILCELKIDPTLPSFVQVSKIEIIDSNNGNSDQIEETGTLQNIEETGSQTMENVDISQSYTWDPDVEQFPINLEKKLTFTSNRGHSFIFPSSNLAYKGMSVSEDFNQVGVNCFSAMNVVKYSDRELVESQGNVVIYECNIKNTFDDSDQTLIYKKVGDKNFVIKINDPAWVNFANNIEIIV